MGAMNACSSSYMNQAVNMANIIVWIYLPYELNDILKQFLVDQHHHSLHHKLMILSLMIYFDQWNFHRTVQFMHAFLACMWTCNVCPALYHEVEHMDVKLNKDEQLLLKMNHCLCMLCICIPYASTHWWLLKQFMCILKLCIQKLRTTHQFQLHSHSTYNNNKT